MIDCPECMEPIRGVKCACGYVVPRVVSFPGDRRSNPETVLTEQARQWLEANGIHKPGMTRAEKTQADREYIKRLARLPRPESNAWAYQIISDIADGVYVTPYAEACAREVTGIEREERKAA